MSKKETIYQMLLEAPDNTVSCQEFEDKIVDGKRLHLYHKLSTRIGEIETEKKVYIEWIKGKTVMQGKYKLHLEKPCQINDDRHIGINRAVATSDKVGSREVLEHGQGIKRVIALEDRSREASLTKETLPITHHLEEKEPIFQYEETGQAVWI